MSLRRKFGPAWARLKHEFGAVTAAFDGMLYGRREADPGMRDSGERFRSLSDASFEGIVISEHGLVLEANRSFACC